MIQDNNARESALLANFSDRKYIFRLRKDKCSSAKSSPKDCFVFLHEWRALLPLHAQNESLRKCPAFFMILGKFQGKRFLLMAKKSRPAPINHVCLEKAVTKNQEKLLVKIAALITECERLYGIRIVHGAPPR